MSNRHTEAHKRMVVEQYGRVSAAELCKQYGIARSTLFLWVKQHTTDQTGQIPRETYLLQKEVERLRTENQIFRVCGCSPASPLSDRIAAIKANQEEFSIHRRSEPFPGPLVVGRGYGSSATEVRNPSGGVAANL